MDQRKTNRLPWTIWIFEALFFWRHFSWDRPWTFRLKRPFRILFDRARWRVKPEWKIAIHIGPGAGYILGRTLYIARNCIDARQPFRAIPRMPIPWQFGFTRNANTVPYVRH